MDPAKLSKHRQALAAAIKTSPLFDTPRFVHNLESAYEEMWAIRGAGQSPRPIKVIDDFSTRAALRGR